MFRPFLFSLSGLLLCAMPLSAASGTAEKYPLRLQVHKAAYGCRNCSSYAAVNPDPPHRYQADSRATADSDNAPAPKAGPPSAFEKHYAGQGSAVLMLDGGKTQTIRFTYNDCLDPLPISNASYLNARWKKTGSTLEVQVPYFTPDKPVGFATKKLTRCELQIATQAKAVTQ